MGVFGRGKENLEQQPEDETVAAEEMGGFLGFVLLSEPEWDKEQFKKDFFEDWGIAIDDNDQEDEEHEDILLLEDGQLRLVISFMPFPVPGGETEHYAAANYLWPEGINAAQTHQAQILVTVLGEEQDPYQRGKLLVKGISSCCRQRYASGIYTSGIVFQPAFYRDFSMLLKEDELPIMNWIWFGIYQDEKRVGMYTYGMKLFGKDEMEVYAEQADWNQLREFLFDLVAYVLNNDIVLHDGETIGFSAEQKLPITRSPGIALAGMTLKIG